MWAGAKDSVWAVGDRGTILFFNGQDWRSVAGATDHPLRSIRGGIGDEVWTSGKDGTLERWDGSAWRVVAVSDGSHVISVWPTAPGCAETADSDGRIRAFDGKRWKTLIPRRDVRSLGLYGRRSPTWAIGYDGVFRRISEKWVNEEFPSIKGSVFFGDAHTGHLWLGGDKGRLFDFDGHGFRAVDSGSKEDLLALGGNPPDELFAIGKHGAIVSNRSAWQPMQSPSEENWRALWREAPDDVWVVGDGGIIHFDGESWQVAETGHAYAAIWGANHADIWMG